MKKSNEQDIKKLYLQIKNIERLLKENNDEVLHKLLRSKRRCLKNAIIDYKKDLDKKQKIINLKEKLLFISESIDNASVYKKVLRK